jgi:hypothetical protein
LETKKLLFWLIVGLPIAGVIAMSLLPLRPFYQQALVGVVFVWFQCGLLLGGLSQ